MTRTRTAADDRSTRPSPLRRRAFLLAAAAGGLGALSTPTVARAPTPFAYQRCKSARVEDASEVGPVSVYYADRDGERRAVYGVPLTRTRAHRPVQVEYAPGRDVARLHLLEPRGSLVNLVADGTPERRRLVNPHGACVPEGFNAAPTATFSTSATTATVGKPVRFTSTAVDADADDRLVLAWDLDGDGVFEASGATVLACYDTAGTLVVSHRVTDDFGATRTSSQELAVDQPSEPVVPDTRVATLLADDGLREDRFGHAVAISGETAVVGAFNARGSALGTGVAYVATGDGRCGWSTAVELVARDGATLDDFGWSVAIDGDVAVVGAPRDDDAGSRSGAAYVFERDGGRWTQAAKLVAPDGGADDFLGWSVAVDGGTAVVATPNDDDNGNGAGAAYVFARDGTGAWRGQGKLVASDGEAGDGFGFAVAVAGDRLLVGAPGVWPSGKVYPFWRNDAGDWTEQQPFVPVDGRVNDRFGHAVDIDGELGLVGAPLSSASGGTGAAYVVELEELGAWDHVATLVPADGAFNDRFGTAVALHGPTALVGRHPLPSTDSNPGAAYVFRDGGSDAWSQRAVLGSGTGDAYDAFGRTVGLDAGTAIVGAPLDDTTAYHAGAASVFE